MEALIIKKLKTENIVEYDEMHSYLKKESERYVKKDANRCLNRLKFEEKIIRNEPKDKNGKPTFQIKTEKAKQYLYG